MRSTLRSWTRTCFLFRNKLKRLLSSGGWRSSHGYSNLKVEESDGDSWHRLQPLLASDFTVISYVSCLDQQDRFSYANGSCSKWCITKYNCQWNDQGTFAPSISSLLSVCRWCQEGTMVQKLRLGNHNKRQYASFELLHFNICGILDKKSFVGNKTLIFIVDRASNCMKSFFLQAKLESEVVIKSYILNVNFVQHDGPRVFATKSLSFSTKIWVSNSK